MNEWGMFFSTILDITKRGFYKPAPLFYFVSIILVAGGVGFWLPIFGGKPADMNSAMTYIFALLAAVVADFFSASRGQDFLDGWETIEKDFTLFVISLVIFIAVLAVVAMVVGCGGWAWASMILSAFLVWYLWWILLEPEKFGIPLSDIKIATIGSTQQPQGAAGKSLQDLKNLRASKGQRNDD
jgi:O-antigen/teichoic acid export membrane protein